MCYCSYGGEGEREFVPFTYFKDSFLPDGTKSKNSRMSNISSVKGPHLVTKLAFKTFFCLLSTVV